MCLFYVVHAWLCKNILLIFCVRDGPVTLISILHLVSCSDMTNCVGMLDLMHAAEVTPTAATYTALHQSFAEAGDKRSLLSTQREASVRAISLNINQIMKVVTSLVTTGHHDIMEDVSFVENRIKLLATRGGGERVKIFAEDEINSFTEDVCYKPWGKCSGK